MKLRLKYASIDTVVHKLPSWSVVITKLPSQLYQLGAVGAAVRKNKYTKLFIGKTLSLTSANNQIVLCDVASPGACLVSKMARIDGKICPNPKKPKPIIIINQGKRDRSKPTPTFSSESIELMEKVVDVLKAELISRPESTTIPLFQATVPDWLVPIADELIRRHMAPINRAVSLPKLLNLINTEVPLHESFINLLFVSLLVKVPFAVFYHKTLLLFGYILMHFPLNTVVFHQNQKSKSTDWMNYLFKDFCTRCGVDTNLIKYTFSGRSSEKSATTLVYFDDMLYSGKQASSNATQFAYDNPKKYNRILIVAPFVGAQAYKTLWCFAESSFLQNLVCDGKPSCDLQLLHVVQVETFQNLVSLLGFHKDLQPKNKNQVAIFFDHKIADNISTKERIINAFVDQSVPVYKTDEYITRVKNDTFIPSRLTRSQTKTLFIDSDRYVRTSSLMNYLAYKQGRYSDLIDTNRKSLLPNVNRITFTSKQTQGAQGYSRGTA